MGKDDIEGVRVGGDRAVERLGEPGSERSSALAELFETDELLDLDEIAGPFHWPELSADEAAREWPALCSWVEQLMARFPHLDHHVIPAAGSFTTATSKRWLPFVTKNGSTTARPLRGPPGSTGIGHFETSRRGCGSGPLSWRVARPMNPEPAKVTRRYPANGMHSSRRTSNAEAAERSRTL